MTSDADLKKHFPQLCADEEVDVQWCDNPSNALALSGELESNLTPHIRSENTDAIAMHELGHIKAQRILRTRPNANARLGIGRATTH